jgi:hypothetical protein
MQFATVHVSEPCQHIFCQCRALQCSRRCAFTPCHHAVCHYPAYPDPNRRTRYIRFDKLSLERLVTRDLPLRGCHCPAYPGPNRRTRYKGQQAFPAATVIQKPTKPMPGRAQCAMLPIYLNHAKYMFCQCHALHCAAGDVRSPYFLGP